jgi:hypothetical protein
MYARRLDGDAPAKIDWTCSGIPAQRRQAAKYIDTTRKLHARSRPPEQDVCRDDQDQYGETIGISMATDRDPAGMTVDS